MPAAPGEALLAFILAARIALTARAGAGPGFTPGATHAGHGPPSTLGAMAVQMAPSILSADFARLASEAEAVSGVADWLHAGGALPAETRAYVRLVTGRSAEEWSQAGSTGAASEAVGALAAADVFRRRRRGAHGRCRGVGDGHRLDGPGVRAGHGRAGGRA